jgi:hypothetical protein
MFNKRPSSTYNCINFSKFDSRRLMFVIWTVGIQLAICRIRQPSSRRDPIQHLDQVPGIPCRSRYMEFI